MLCRAEVEVGRDPRSVTELLNWLEQEFNQGEAPEKDLIGLGFVETIPGSPEGDQLLDKLGPSLRHVAKELGLFN